jgi:hypothetical protein
MKFLFLIPFLFPFVLFPQDNSRSVFTIKPSLGVNGCQIHGDNYSGYNKLGLFVGTAVNARLTNKTSLDIGFYFSQKGARRNPNPAKGDYSYYRVNLDYIDLHLLLRYKLNPVYFITVGPSLAYLINYNENIDYVDFTGAYKFNKFETGVNIGLGRKMLKDKFFVEVRSSNSITSIRDYGQFANLVFYPNPVARFFNKGFYNNILTLMFSYNIDLKKKSETQQP